MASAVDDSTINTVVVIIIILLLYTIDDFTINKLPYTRKRYSGPVFEFEFLYTPRLQFFLCSYGAVVTELVASTELSYVEPG